MPNLTAVTFEQLGNKFWKRFDSYAFTSEQNIAPLVLAELPKALKTFPLCFIKQGEGYVLVALQSFTPQQNLYVNHKGQWLASYVPSCFRSYPFRLAKPADRDALILCVDADSGLITDTEGEPFFQENGSFSESVVGIVDFLKKVERNRIVTQQAVAELTNANVICEWPLKIKDGDEVTPIAGLYRIDEARLNSLDEFTFLKLRKAQSLPIAYAQLFSMENTSVLRKLAGMKRYEQPPEFKEEDLERLFSGDDLIRFD